MKSLKSIIYSLSFISLIFLSSCGYNGGIERDEKVSAAWGQVQNVYQRRADLIPNLVSTVKGFATQEKEVLVGVIEARAKATSINIDASKLTPENVKQYQVAQEGLSGALSRLMMVTENYPQLKSNQNFLELQSQLEGTENRIAVERRNFNDAVKDYNTWGRKFPNNLFSGMWDFTKKGYFEADASAQKAPTVKF
ncbi:MAG: LemA family protein [Cytophagales bacterium]|nr:MAG: LemA family protein [Cytophagales bacterium]